IFFRLETRKSFRAAETYRDSASPIPKYLVTSLVFAAGLSVERRLSLCECEYDLVTAHALGLEGTGSECRGDESGARRIPCSRRTSHSPPFSMFCRSKAAVKNR